MASINAQVTTIVVYPGQTVYGSCGNEQDKIVYELSANTVTLHTSQLVDVCESDYLLTKWPGYFNNRIIG